MNQAGTDPILNKERMGSSLQVARENAGLSKDEASRMLISEGLATRPTQIERWESGKYTPTLGRVVMMAAIYGVTLDELVGDCVYEKRTIHKRMKDTLRYMRRSRKRKDKQTQRLKEIKA